MERIARRCGLLMMGLAFLAGSPPPAAGEPGSPPAGGQAPSGPPKTSVAVYQIKPAGSDPSIAAAMTSLLGTRLTPSPRLRVIEESMLKTVMERQGQNASDACDDSSCQVEIGKLVKAQKIITGDLTKFGSKWILATKVVDVQTGTSDFSTEDKCMCSEDQLEDLVGNAANKIRNHFGENLPVTGQAPPVAAAPPPAQAVNYSPAAEPAKKMTKADYAAAQQAARDARQAEVAQKQAARQTALAQVAAQQVVAAAPAAPPPPPTAFKQYSLPGTKGGPMVLVTDYSFYIDQYEVTNQDYQGCVSAGGCRPNKKFKGSSEPMLPVVGVGQDQARAYCQWAGKRLPTSQEWTQAAGGPEGRAYPWGSNAPRCNLANFGDCNVGKTMPVGSKPEGISPYGALDMAGNAYEWVEEDSILRGGSFNNNGNLIKSTSKMEDQSISGVDSDYGFRCAHN